MNAKPESSSAQPTEAAASPPFRMGTRSLRFRLIIWYAGLLIWVFVLLGVAMSLGLDHYLERSLRESLDRRARQIGESLLAQIEQTGDAFVVAEINARYAPESYDRFIRVTRSSGKVLYASGRTKDSSFDPTHLPILKPDINRNFARKETLPNDTEILVATTVFKQREKFFIEVGGPLRPIKTILGQMLFGLALGLPAVVAVAVGGGYLLVGRALAPVIKIAESAERITLHNLSERLPLTPTGDELEQLSRALNHMIARLHEAFEQNRRFLADASHELRTPITALRGELESVVEQARTAPELCDRIGSALEEVDRLAKIVERLFAISRLDAGEAQGEWVRFDLAHLAATTAEQMCLLAEDKGVSVKCESAQAVFVQGDRARLKQVVVNLLDNAIKYTPQGGSVTLRVGMINDSALLQVEDNGIGIPAGALPHVFERFFRVDKARSREMGGAGLGLAIVKSICVAHGGQVDVQSTEGRGSRFSVELPLATNGINKEKSSDPS